MMSGKSVIGVIALQNDDVVNLYGPEDQEVLQSMAAQAAVAIGNARLYQELGDANRNLQQTQDEIVRMERLMEANRWGMEFAHHLNNYAGTIPSRATQVIKLLDPYDARQSQALEELTWIQSDTNRLLELANVMKQAFPTEAAPELIDINTIVCEVWEDVKRSIAPERLEQLRWETELTDGLPKVRAVYSTLRSAISNIVKNAVEAIVADGSIRVTTGIVTTADHTSIQIIISDTGVGISEKDQKRIFNPLFTRKKERGGLGMGLWLTKTTIQGLGGDIRVSSEEGKGTTFFITVPVGRV
jgi:signal transduction histidine kinase